MNDDFYMNLAINEAWKYQILTYPNPAVGCVILDKNGKILSIEAHKQAGKAHAEVNAVKKALQVLNPNLIFPKEDDKIYEFIIKHHNNLLKNSKAYVTLEPCSHYGKTPPCANLLKEIGISEVVIGYEDKSDLAKGGANLLKEANINVKFGILKDRCFELLEPFLMWQRGNFSFLKLGMSINGVVSGGIITNLDSRKMVHKLREKIDLLVIGGNTVRVDRPTLDTRLINNGKNPDIFIYSKKQNFDKSIPLFGVENRKVTISNDIKLIKNYKLCMFEGGENLLNNLPNFVSHILIFSSTSFMNRKAINADVKIQKLFSFDMKDNFYIWYKIKS
ncbi:diaminohydroxyphosphoribosylaminopyrimidine deaminase / 5-amino-6-(5-phosphoribosylamino)uracil reductase [Campylobacter blaseri]|uniref:Riboflavin biosynthesis protein RibD n=1 Tax=Campylobacter blaseri TaxID=2042961 RepID=A0A2P8QZ95_9BACT|nr:bifunctional diaminohydroxyphosphoribosylaminopyrimidine deaminase/5-amino-6-(5-phosphoribosylamino)uracil reductase RibD [Campylobacter blaseri]PSM51570.1 riboflavin biosynthesis protein RibD [Campylobacter blaseri]PSM53363.1 riboflavin biosynthesis protein RibD [Campylobacter blaseri]QKF86658.1 diaminohydroxyphosphoribosylaminopyrimidine deaminase / 5-amino-6-(5-phosphoribosylamino)uracil reductase [Campylobacter blaseri]